MAWIAGVDGCPGGWTVVYADTELKNLECCVKKDFKDVLERPGLVVVAVDMPIGLSEKGKRGCDGQARSVLGDRSRSIFSAPATGLFREIPREELGKPAAHKRASERNRKLTGGTGLSIQSWSLAPKIADVRDYLSKHSDKVDVVHEVHPEISFAAMNYLEHGGESPPFSPMRHPKGSMQGLLERRVLLAREFGGTLDALEGKARGCNGDAAPDDFYDAVACLWTAHRISKGAARALCRLKGICTLANCADKDANGLPMRIVY